MTADDGLHVFDVSSPDSPVARAVVGPKALRRLTKSGGRLFASQFGSGIVAFDTIDPDHPTQVGTLAWQHWPSDLHAAGDTLVVATPYEGVWTVDVSDPANMALLASVKEPGYGLRIAVASGRAYVVHGDGMYGIAIGNPRQPQRFYAEDGPG